MNLNSKDNSRLTWKGITVLVRISIQLKSLVCQLHRAIPPVTVSFIESSTPVSVSSQILFLNEDLAYLIFSEERLTSVQRVQTTNEFEALELPRTWDLFLHEVHSIQAIPLILSIPSVMSSYLLDSQV